MSYKTLKENSFGKVIVKSKTPDVDILYITHKQCSASLSLYGGQVLTWQPEGHAPVFWMSNSSTFQAGKAIRGGIPICWPWFGGYKDAGNHGFARTQQWQVNSIDIHETAVNIEIEWQGQGIHPLWANKAALVQNLTFGRAFEQTLTMFNLSEHDVTYTGALHSYFNVSHPENVKVSALEGVPFDCKVTGDKQAQDHKIDGTGPVDRIYYTNAPMKIVDQGLQRTLLVSAINTQQWVYWNAGKQVVDTMSDMHLGAENEYLCLEAANTNWQTIATGQKVSLSQKVQIA